MVRAKWIKLNRDFIKVGKEFVREMLLKLESKPLKGSIETRHFTSFFFYPTPRICFWIFCCHAAHAQFLKRYRHSCAVRQKLSFNVGTLIKMCVDGLIAFNMLPSADETVSLYTAQCRQRQVTAVGAYNDNCELYYVQPGSPGQASSARFRPNWKKKLKNIVIIWCTGCFKRYIPNKRTHINCMVSTI